MKKIKEFTRWNMVLIMLCISAYASAALTISINTGGTAYLCPGVEYIIQVNCPYPDNIPAGSGNWTWCNTCGASYTAPTTYITSEAYYFTLNSGTETVT